MPRPRIRCKWHKEETPSLVLYTHHFHCYGCGKRGQLSELDGIELPPIPELDPEPEDLTQAFKYIDSLPLKAVRGLELPCDDRSYFVPWPDKNYYKQRYIHADKAKYIGAAGHQKPLFIARKQGSPILAIVEGEINALSAAKAYPELDVCSPGGVGDFTESRTKKYYTFYKTYSTVLLMVDADKPGAKACMELMGFLTAHGHKVVWRLMGRDANEILVGDGVAGLRQNIFEILGRDLAQSLTDWQMSNRELPADEKDVRAPGQVS